MPGNRLLAIGDIHGHCAALRSLVDHAKIGPQDTVVTLGDYVDRGPDSRGVIGLLLGLEKRTRLIALRGNHEIMLLESVRGVWKHQFWTSCGGSETLASYQVASAVGLPDEHWDFLRRLLPYYETDTHLFVHANLDPVVPLEFQFDETLFWEHMDRSPGRHLSGKTIVCGHTPQARRRPRHFGPAICIDTGIYEEDGWLTCLDVASGCYWQANAAGQCRSDVLETPEEKEDESDEL